MSESARDLARKLLEDSRSSGPDLGPKASAADLFDTSAPPQRRRVPGQQFADHPDVVAAVRQRAMIAELFVDSGLPNPLFLPRTSPNDSVIRAGESESVNFSAYNYLGLANHPRVIAGAKQALDQYGASAAASRIVGGEIALYQELEQRLASIYGVGDALVTTSGYSTNAGVIGFLLGEGDVAVCDALIHGSVIAGTKWAGARRMRFRHNDPDALRSVLQTSRKQFDRALVVLEGHYSMDGTVGRIDELASIAKEYDCAVMVDEAHSFAVFGEHGYGIREHYGLSGDAVDIWMGTLSKALGSVGGFIAGDADLVGAMKWSAQGVASLTGGSAPSAIGAALAALDVLADEPDRLAVLWANARHFHSALIDRGIDLGSSQCTPIVPVIVPGEVRAAFVSARLLQQGVYACVIAHPAVPAGRERLRFLITSEHTAEQLARTVGLVVEAIDQVERIADPTIDG